MSLPMIDATYRARACGAAQFEQGEKNLQIAVPFEIVDETGEFNGQTITWFGTLHDTADSKGKTGKQRVIESLIYMGFQGDDLLELMDISDDQARALMPDLVDLVVGPDEYNGVTRLKVKWVNRAGGSRAGFKKPLSKDEMRATAAQMRNTLKNARGGAQPVRAPATNQQSRGAAQQPHPNAPGSGTGWHGANPKDDTPF
jgi:hypothetical protein